MSVVTENVSARSHARAFFLGFRLCVTQEESLGLYHFHNQGCATSGRLSSGTNTEDRTLTQESGDVRSVEGEVCGAVLVDE